MCWFFSKEKREQARMKKEGKRLLRQKAKDEEKARKQREKEEKKERREAERKGEEYTPSPSTEPELDAQEQTAVVEEQVSSAPVDATEERAVDDTEKAKKPRPANYHISLREDGRWQVKRAKGGRANKIFMTQAEAIAYAKERAEIMDGSITIHKKDGKIRKQKYTKAKPSQTDETNE